MKSLTRRSWQLLLAPAQAGLWVTPPGPAWGLMYSSQALSGLRRKASFRRKWLPAINTCRPGKWLPASTPWLSFLPAWTFTACNLVTLDYLTLEPASPALLLGTLLTRQPVTGTALPADTGPHSASTNWATLWLYNQDAASWTLHSPWAMTMALTHMPVLALGPSLQRPLNAPLPLSRVYNLSEIESFTPQMSAMMSTCDIITRWHIRMENNCFSYQHIPLPEQTSLLNEDTIQLTTVKSFHSTGIYWALIMCQALCQAF